MSVVMSVFGKSRPNGALGTHSRYRFWSATLLNAGLGIGTTLALPHAEAQSEQPKVTATPTGPGRANIMSQPKATYRPVSFANLPTWNEDDHLAALKAFQTSCMRLARSAAETKPPVSRVASPEALQRVCKAARDLPAKLDKAAARAFFEREFVPNEVVHEGPAGMVTGYYEPVLDGSRTPDKRFTVPIHKRPTDLVNLVDETERGARDGSPTHARATENGNVPYATRAEIEQGALSGKGLELVYLVDPVEKFFMQIQGSGRIRLPDGSMIRLAYAGKNGHPYTSVGRYLIDQNIIGADRMTLDALGDWLRADR